MAALALWKSAWDAGTNQQRRIMRAFGGYYLQLGNPAILNDGTRDQLAFDDGRFEERVVCYFGCLCGNIGDIPAGYDVTNKTDRQIRDDTMFWLEGGGGASPVDRGLRLPGAIPNLGDAENRWQALLDANGAPAWVKMGPGVPDHWTPVGGE